jgi:hypothetical protein
MQRRAVRGVGRANTPIVVSLIIPCSRFFPRNKKGVNCIQNSWIWAFLNKEVRFCKAEFAVDFALSGKIWRRLVAARLRPSSRCLRQWLQYRRRCPVFLQAIIPKNLNGLCPYSVADGGCWPVSPAPQSVGDFRSWLRTVKPTRSPRGRADGSRGFPSSSEVWWSFEEHSGSYATRTSAKARRSGEAAGRSRSAAQALLGHKLIEPPVQVAGYLAYLLGAPM